MKNPVTGEDVSGLNPGDFGDKPLRLSQFIEMLKFAKKHYGDRDPFVVFGIPVYGNEEWRGFIPNGFWDADNLDAGFMVLEDNTGIQIGEKRENSNFGFLSKGE